MRVWFIVLLGFASAAHGAESAAGTDPVAWLKRMASASRQLNYSGTIVYQHRTHVETSRVVHFVNPAGGEFEKLETLDGPPREIIRSNDQVICYLPATKTVLIEERNRSARNFPALLPESLGAIADNYTIHRGNVDRVAGHDCQWILLEPKDNHRYGRRYCAELGSALPLRAQTLEGKERVVESFGFSEVTIGGSFSGERVKSKYADRSRAQNWKIDRSRFMPPDTATSGDTGWLVTSLPAGFRKLMEAKRSTGGRRSISQLVFSDGLAAVSVFIEPAPAQAQPEQTTHQGAVNIYTRTHRNHVVTVLGEAPISTIKTISASLEPKPNTAALQ
jgi:sigma-E factor negative regulatory protein RseB